MYAVLPGQLCALTMHCTDLTRLKISEISAYVCACSRVVSSPAVCSGAGAQPI